MNTKLKSIWIAMAVLLVSVVANQFATASTLADNVVTRPLGNVHDAASNPDLGYPFTHGQYNHARRTVTQSVSTLENDVSTALSADVTFVDSVQNGNKIYSVITVSQDAGSAALSGHGSAVLFTRSDNYGKTWTDYVTLDPTVISAGANPAQATADAVSSDMVANARIARAGDTIYVAFLSNAMQIGGANDHGAPTGHVSLDIGTVGSATRRGIYSAFKPVNDNVTVTDPSTGRVHSPAFNLHVFITASTDDGVSWQTPRMIPTAYDRFLGGWYAGGAGNGYNGGGNTHADATDENAQVTYDSALPGSLDILALGDGTSVDRVFLAWLDMTSHDAQTGDAANVNDSEWRGSNVFGGNADAAGAVSTLSTGGSMRATKPIFAALTFDNSAADTGSASAIHYVVSDVAFKTLDEFDRDAFDGQVNTVDGADDIAQVTWDKVKLVGVANPNGYYEVDVNGNSTGVHSLTADKVWLVGHTSANSGAIQDTAENSIRIGEYSTAAAFAGRNGGNSGLFPQFTNIATIDHTGAHTTATNVGSAEEFDFDAVVDGTFDTPQVVVFLTSNFSTTNVLNLLGVVRATNTTSNTAASAMYVVNLRQAVAATGLKYTMSRVSYDTATGFRAGAFSALGSVTYSNPKVAVVGNGVNSNGAVSDDLVVVAFEAKGITRDDIATWTDITNSIDTNAGYAQHGYLTADNVYVLTNRASGAYSQADGDNAWNFSRASRVDGHTSGNAWNNNVISSNSSSTVTRDSVSSDSVLLDLQALEVANNNNETETLIAVTFVDYTPGGSKSRVTADRMYSAPNVGTTYANGRNDGDVYLGQIVAKAGEFEGNQFSIGSSRISTEATTSDGVAFIGRVGPISADVSVVSRSQKVLNRNFFELNFLYLANLEINNDGLGRYSRGGGVKGSGNRNYDVIARTVEVGDLVDALRSSSSGVCLIGHKDEIQRARR